jgi:hypothetical protein
MSGTSHRLEFCTAFVVYRFIICKCSRGLHNTSWTGKRDPRTGGGGGVEPPQYRQYSVLQMIYQHKRLQTILRRLHYDTFCTLCSALKNAWHFTSSFRVSYYDEVLILVYTENFVVTHTFINFAEARHING